MDAAFEGDFSYATDGGILIRVPRISNVPERGDAPKNVGASILQNLDATSRCLPVAKPAGEAMKVRPKRRGCGNHDCPHCSGSLECGMCKRSGQIVDCTFVEELRFISRHLRLRTLPNVQWQLRQASNILPF
jgi:hypothetical protein